MLSHFTKRRFSNEKLINKRCRTIGEEIDLKFTTFRKCKRLVVLEDVQLKS